MAWSCTPARRRWRKGRRRFARELESAKLEAACLSTSIAMAGDRREHERLAGEVRQAVDLAQMLGCGMVRILDAQMPTGPSRPQLIRSFGNWLLPLADYAASNGTVIAIENAITFRTARDVWSVLEQHNHPALACCWNSLTATLAGESPSVSVPVLNHRIRHVHLTDATLTSEGPVWSEPGRGEVPVEKGGYPPGAASAIADTSR